MLKRFSRLIGFISLLGMAFTVVADWVAISDARLILEAELIVYGQYQGQSTLTVGDKALTLNLGVLKPSKILKGQNTSVIFIQRYQLNAPIRSDMLFLKQGQEGLWFLRSVPDMQGVYQIMHPSGYKALTENGEEMQFWQQQVQNNYQQD